MGRGPKDLDEDDKARASQERRRRLTVSGDENLIYGGHSDFSPWQIRMKKAAVVKYVGDMIVDTGLPMSHIIEQMIEYCMQNNFKIEVDHTLERAKKLARWEADRIRAARSCGFNAVREAKEKGFEPEQQRIKDRERYLDLAKEEKLDSNE